MDKHYLKCFSIKRRLGEYDEMKQIRSLIEHDQERQNIRNDMDAEFLELLYAGALILLIKNKLKLPASRNYQTAI